jgi:hypothetical protein
LDFYAGSFDNLFDDEPHMQRFILDPVTAVRSEMSAARTDKPFAAMSRPRREAHESYMKERHAAQCLDRALQHPPGTSIQLESQPVLNH